MVPGAEDPLLPDEVAAYTLIIQFPLEDQNQFPLDFPIPFGDPKRDILKCLYNKLKPANVLLRFVIEQENDFPLSFPIVFLTPFQVPEC